MLRAGFRAGIAAAMLTALTGCGAVDLYRSARGIDKNDPDPATTPFSKNLADADAAVYPNLASVPPPPTRATSAEERQKLAQALIAERSSVEQAGGAPAPAAPAAPAKSSGVAAAAPVAPASPAMAATASAAAQPAATAASPTPAATAATAASGRILASNATGPRRPGERETPPLNSTLEMPQVRSVPEPEETRPAPPPPSMAAVPRVNPAPLPPAAMEAATPQPAPPVPVVLPVPPPPPALTTATTPAPRRGAPTVIASVEVSSDNLTMTPVERSRLAEIAGLYAQQPGSVRVIAHTTTGATGPEQLTEYRAALDRAQAIVRTLSDAGIPANKIQAEAAPVPPGGPVNRIEVQFAR